MTREELREKVARLLCTLRGQDPDSVFYRVRLKGGHETIRRWMNYTREADAVIALCMKGAAKVAGPSPDDAGTHRSYRQGREDAAAAICALIPSEVKT